MVKDKPKCHKYDNYRYIAKECGSKNVQQVHYAKDVGEETSMFFACNSSSMIKEEHVWFIDNGCSNYMTCHESLLINVDRNVTTRIIIENGQIVQAVVKGTLVIETKNGTRYIKEVMMMQWLDENLLNVEHMMQHGYFLLFGDDAVAIFEERKLENHVVTTQMTKIDISLW